MVLQTFLKYESIILALKHGDSHKQLCSLNVFSQRFDTVTCITLVWIDQNVLLTFVKVE